MLPVSTSGKQMTKHGKGRTSCDDPNTVSINLNKDEKGEQ
jgi:hypothetical protein